IRIPKTSCKVFVLYLHTELNVPFTLMNIRMGL
ncbi:unnamed protein product, partial [marine sediment metagenome]